MRRKFDAIPPPELLVFEGFRYKTEASWGIAFDQFHSARERWEAEWGPLPVWVTNGDCPWDPDLI